MVRVAKPWFIYGYHGLITVTKVFYFICSKTMVNIRKVFLLCCMACFCRVVLISLFLLISVFFDWFPLSCANLVELHFIVLC